MMRNYFSGKQNRNTRRGIALLLALFLVITSLGPIALPSAAVAEEGGQIETFDWSRYPNIPLDNWLSYMPDDMPISRINMLASHDSGCFRPISLSEIPNIFSGLSDEMRAAIKAALSATSISRWLSRTQEGSITWQLEHGARVFDVRGGYFEVNSETDPYDLWINHKVPMLNEKGRLYKMREVLDEIDTFLKRHPQETVVVNMGHEGFNIPYVTDWMTAAKNLVRSLCWDIWAEYPRFKCYTPADQSGERHYAPTLREARGKCIVLCAYDDPVTAYENNWDVTLDDKFNYVTKFFKDHNGEEGQSVFSNIGGQYKADLFRDDGYRNEDIKAGNLKDPQVKIVNYTANKPVGATPEKVADKVKKTFTDNYFLPEIRYGWIGQDFIGSIKWPDPVKGIIYSNIGCTNYYNTIDLSGCSYPTELEPSDFSLIGFYGEAEQAFELQNYKTVIEEDENDANKLHVSILGLPLYAPTGVRYDYQLTLKNNLFRLDIQDHAINTGYTVRDGKWCGQSITEKAKICTNETAFPLEIQYVVDSDYSYTEPTDHKSFFFACNGGMFFKRTTASGKVEQVVVKDPYAANDAIHLTDFKLHENAGGNYYATSMVNLPAKSQRGEEYTYTLEKVLFRNGMMDAGEWYYKSELVPGTDDQPRAIIYVYNKYNDKEVPGTIHWWDGGNTYATRENALAPISRHLDDAILPLGISKITEKTTNRDLKNSFDTISTENNTTTFSNFTRKYDGYNLEYDCTYEYRDSYLDGYYKKMNADGADKNDLTLALCGKADLTVVWNGEVPGGITKRIVSLTPQTSQEYQFKADISSQTTSGDAKVWTSEEQMIPLYFDETEPVEFRINTTGLEVEDFVCTTGIICDEDENGIPIRHFMLYYDDMAEKTPIAGNITWIDGEPGLNHDNDNRKIQIIPFVDGQEGDPADISEMEWYGNHYYIVLPSYTEEGKAITYEARMPAVSDYQMEQSPSTYDIKYTKVVDVVPVGNLYSTNLFNQYPESVKLYRNGEEVPSAEYYRGFTEQPIANDNNVMYAYDIMFDCPLGGVVVEHKEPSFNEDTLIWSVPINCYVTAEDCQIPVKLNMEGDGASENFEFTLLGTTDEGEISDSLLLTANTSGYLTIPAKELLQTKQPYEFLVYQEEGGTAGMDYDDHISLVEVNVSFEGDERQKLTMQWLDEEEQAASASVFTNTNTYGKKLALFEDEAGTVLDQVIFTPGETPSTSVVPNKKGTEEYSYVFKSWKNTETTEEDLKKAPGWDKENISVYKPVFEKVDKYKTATFVDEDGTTVLGTQQTRYGKVPEYKGGKPTKPSDREYDYEFIGWNPELAPITADTTYQAKYEAEPIRYEFTKGDGSIYQKGSRQGLEFRLNGPANCVKDVLLGFESIEVKILPAEDGSTRFVLPPAQLDALEAGDHLIMVNYQNGTMPAAYFTIEEKPTPSGGGQGAAITMKTVEFSLVDEDGTLIGGADLHVEGKYNLFNEDWTSEEGTVHKIVLRQGTYRMVVDNAPNEEMNGQSLEFRISSSGQLFIITNGEEQEVESIVMGNALVVTSRDITPETVENPETAPTDDTNCPLDAFSDLDKTEWYHDGIHYCLENGLMKGMSKTVFAPGTTITRAMIVAILCRLEGEPEFTNDNVFTDVESGSWYEKAVAWANSQGIVRGYGDGTFGPDDPVTREQLALILYKYAQYKEKGFTGGWVFLLDLVDRASISEWADEAVHWCSMKGIISGKEGKVFDPQGNATRAEAASMIQRFCKVMK